MSRWPPMAQNPRLPPCNLVSTCVINELYLRSVHGAYRHRRRFCFIKSNPHALVTPALEETTVWVFLWMSFSFFWAVVLTVISLHLQWFVINTADDHFPGWMPPPYLPSSSSIWNFCLGSTFSCSLAFLWRFLLGAELILRYWLTRSCFARSHKTSL